MKTTKKEIYFNNPSITFFFFFGLSIKSLSLDFKNLKKNGLSLRPVFNDYLNLILRSIFGRFRIDTRKIEPTPTFMRPPWKDMERHILTGIPKGSGSERFRREAAKIIQENYERHEKIYTDGSKKDERAGFLVITPNRTYRRRVHQQSTVFSTEQEAVNH
jgi:hypothetical protein